MKREREMSTPLAMLAQAGTSCKSLAQLPPRSASRSRERQLAWGSDVTPTFRPSWVQRAAATSTRYLRISRRTGDTSAHRPPKELADARCYLYELLEPQSQMPACLPVRSPSSYKYTVAGQVVGFGLGLRLRIPEFALQRH